MAAAMDSGNRSFSGKSHRRSRRNPTVTGDAISCSSASRTAACVSFSTSLPMMVMRMIDGDGGGGYLVSGSIWFESRLSSRFACRDSAWLWVQVHSSRLGQHRVDSFNTGSTQSTGQCQSTLVNEVKPVNTSG
ncbi:hypothetical protein HanHA300_Chr14g0530121 [Helianthus annuus]|uniref:Uncharacterized protein n=1 Tax=Helianthus annuus TaxID=4232 RepID=A0A251SK61_HELAN|nr:uncharacterized protein LOC110903867 isoform X2 [Helianthus annuus]KAJ0464689.1 hypothetical protein HanHA300_Chr14g0530121 [Helianthus annuus]KAJ0469332.1 hypothetical protein HanIR_Chr14g0706751 [Helianthus annuus]KAJ0486286.1 hypothetical protein HanHA89_Chr14g0577991 [Helianthus annuus]KAJ0656838.1 hypothetical protein HanLR1_Chr14g0540411 [Helianthus annuus]KAJ0660436.1 hypothetical protein HanOQP8_Chr14g0537751 [Helianthus annuus]